MADANEPILTLTEDDVETKYNVNELSDEAKVIYNKLADLQKQYSNIAVSYTHLTLPTKRIV